MSQNEVSESDQLIAATDAFIHGASGMAQQGCPVKVIINALVSSILTVSYTVGAKPDDVAAMLREAARQVPTLFDQQAGIDKGMRH